jgi:hypothetical protein
MKEERQPEWQSSDQDWRLTKAQILIAVLTAVTAIAGCVEQLAR